MTPEQIRLLRARLQLSEEQLPDDANPEQITAALAPQQPASNPSAPAIQPTDSPGNPGVAPTGPDPGGGPPSPDQVPDPNGPNPGNLQANALPEGYIAVPAEAWQTVQANAAAGAQLASTTEAHRRDGILIAAVREGRIAPSQRDNFRNMFERDPQGTENLLTASVDKGGLMPGTIPVEARGVDPQIEAAGNDLGYPAEWLPDVHQKRDEQHVVTVEG